MAIAPLAALGIAQTAFSLIDTIAGAMRSSSTQSQVQTKAQLQAQAEAQAKARETLWHQIGQAVDVTSMSQEDLATMAQVLYDNGAISVQDKAMMSLDPSFAGSSSLLTGTDAAGNVDWMAEFRARYARHSAVGDSTAAAGDQRVLDILARLQAGGRGGVSIRV